MAEIAFGTCGWSYAEWEGIFYPEKSGKLVNTAKFFLLSRLTPLFTPYQTREPFEAGLRGLLRDLCSQPNSRRR